MNPKSWWRNRRMRLTESNSLYIRCLSLTFSVSSEFDQQLSVKTTLLRQCLSSYFKLPFALYSVHTTTHSHGWNRPETDGKAAESPVSTLTKGWILRGRGDVKIYPILTPDILSACRFMYRQVNWINNMPYFLLSITLHLYEMLTTVQNCFLVHAVRTRTFSMFIGFFVCVAQAFVYTPTETHNQSTSKLPF